MMRTISIRIWAVLAFGILLATGCANKKAAASKYNYLIKEESASSSTGSKANEDEAMKASAKHLGVSERLVPVLAEAKDYLGTPYQYGGSSKSGIDCSGLTMVCFEKAGVALPRSAQDQSGYGTAVKRKDLKIGDLVFFDAKGKGKVDHVGMVTMAEGEKVIFIHSSTSKGVRYDYLNEGYWADKLVDARRPVE